MQLRDLDSFYEYVDAHALDHERPGQIADIAQRLRDRLHEQGDVDGERKAQWEVDMFNFRIKDGELRPVWTAHDEAGEEHMYPDICRYGDDALDYFEFRFNAAANPLVRARSGTILWASTRKNEVFGKTAADSFLELVKHYEAMDCEAPGKHYGLRVLDCMRNARGLARQMNWRSEDMLSELRKLVLNYSLESSSSLALRIDLTRLMLAHRGRFRPAAFEGFADVCWKVAESVCEGGNLHGAISMLEVGDRVDAKRQETTHEWQKREAELYEALMTEAQDTGNLAAMTFCQSAVDLYRKLKDEGKVSELESKYTEIRNDARLSEIKTEVDVTASVRRAKATAATLAEQEPTTIINVLAADPNLLPKYEDVESIAENSARQFPVARLFPATVMDERGHPAEHFFSEEEKKRHGMLQVYESIMQIDRACVIEEVLKQATAKGKLCTDVLLRFFDENSWLGATLTARRPDGATIEYRWVDLIRGALTLYFEEVQRQCSGAEQTPLLIPATDSLVLKLEGMVRELCRFCRVDTSYHTQDRQGRKVVREKDINVLLREEALQDLVGRDDLFFLKFLLVEKAGLNLRHRVAHSLLLPFQYSIVLAHFAFLAILRLSKYQVTSVTAQGEGGKPEVERS